MMNSIGIAPRLARERIWRAFQEFLQVESLGGLLLLAATLLALAWANSPLAAGYKELWETHFTVGLGAWVLDKSIHFWINDGLMVVFFFVVGLEIKRELLVGELASPRQAILPIFAALGGMLVPALIYLSLNGGQAGAAGWGIPMATDIAFALTVLTVLGPRVPLALKVFLTALAIVDDIGAILVIAVFYAGAISIPSLAVGAGILVLLVGANAAGVRNPLLYGLLGIALWLAMLLSGVHTTIAGVLLAMTIPSRPRASSSEFLETTRRLLGDFESAGLSDRRVFINPEQLGIVQAVETACEHVATPLQQMEHALLPWVTYAILPLFALANAGVGLTGSITAALTHPVSIGIMLGLVLGKQMGITLFTWLAVRVGAAALPAGISWRQIYAVSWLGGIGFTMSLFVADLAFGAPELLALAKVGILAASLVAGVGGWLLVRGATEARG